MSFQIHVVKIILAQCLVQNNCYGIAQVQRTDISDHRDPYAGFLTLETQYRRDERIIRFLTFKQDKFAVEYSEKRRAKLSNKQEE